MRSILFTLLALFLFQACQVNEKVTSAKELSSNTYPITNFQVVLSEDGWKKLGSTITIKLIHAHALTVAGAPSIEVKIGEQIRNFNYQSGSGSDTLTFGYTVTSDDLDENGIEILNNIQLNGGSITYLDTTGVATSTLTTFVPPAYNIRVDGEIPTLLSIKAPNSGNYNTNSHLIYALRFNENVIVSGSPKIDIGLGSGTVSASYSGGTGSKVLTFDYKILSSDNDNDGFVTSSSITLNPATNIAITDQAGNSISATIPSLSSQSLFVDYRSPNPKLISVTPSTLTGLAIAQPVDFTIEFPEPMAVIPSAQISILLPSGVITAKYLSGSNSTNIKFRYLVQNGLENFSNINLLSPVELTSTNNLYVNSAVPTIMNVTGPNPSTYTVGQNMDFTVLFSSPVNVTGLPAISLNLTTGTVKAKYLSGAPSNTLVFRYTVEAEKQDLDGISVGNQLLLMGGSIKDSTNTFNALLGMPAVTTTGVFVNSVTGPSVLFAYAPPAAIYKEGQNLDFTLVFNRPITVSGTPQLPINLGGVTPTVIYANFQPALSSGNTAVFRYTVNVGDNDIDGLTITAPINLNSGNIIDSIGLNANLYYPAPNMSGIFVDGLAPYIMSFTAPTSGTYGPGQILTFTATYNEVVTVTSGQPQIPITLASGPVFASYSTGSGTNTLNFTYQVQAGHSDPDGITVISPLLMSGASVQDGVAHPQQTPYAFTVPPTAGIIIDGSAPSVTGLTVSPIAGTVKLGQSFTFTTTWSEPIIVSGNPRLELSIGGTTAYANFQSCSTSTSCTFKYNVGTGHQDTNGVTISSTLINTSLGTIKDASANIANLNIASFVSTLNPSMSSLFVDGVVPSITSIVASTSTNHTYIIGQNIDFTVTWTEPVTVSGASYISLVIGSQTVQAPNISGSGTNTHVYRYTVASGDYDNNGITLYSTVYPVGGSLIHDANWNTANLSFVPPLTNLMLVDGILPTIGLITPPANETYHLGEQVNFTFHWSEPISVNTSGGIPKINVILSGSTTSFPPVLPLLRDASYNQALSSGANMVFSYTVQAGDMDADGLQLFPTVIDLNGGTIQDIPGNDAATPINFNSPVLTGVLVDAIRPYVTSINPPSNGTYGVGDDLDFTLHFSEAVTVTPSLPESPYFYITFPGTSTPAAKAYYVSGSGTNDLVFRYTAALGENTSSSTFYGLSISGSIQLAGGTIQDTAGNNSYLNLPFSWYPSIKIDGTAPTISGTPTSTNGSAIGAGRDYVFRSGETIRYSIPFSETVSCNGNPRLELNIDGNTRYANCISVTPATNLIFTYTVDAGDALLDLDGISVSSTIDQSQGTIEDSAHNPLVSSLNFTEKDYIHYGGITGRYQISPSNYTTYNGTNYITSVKDLSGFGNDLAKPNILYNSGPSVSVNGFGQNSTGYIQYNNQKLLKTTKPVSLKHVVAVFKSQFSTTSASSGHDLLRNKPSLFSSIDSALSLRSTFSTKTIHMDTSARYFINNASFSSSYLNDIPSMAWSANTNYIVGLEYSSTVPFYIGSEIGSSGFNGQIAELIFIAPNSNLTDAQILKIRDQLNAIHGVY